MADNCIPEEQALAAAQAELQQAAQKLQQAKGIQQQAASAAQQAQNTISSFQDQISHDEQRINNDRNAISAGSTLNPKLPGDLASLNASLEAYKSDIDNLNNQISGLQQGIADAKNVMAAKDAADAQVLLAENVVNDDQGLVNAAQLALDRCRNKANQTDPPAAGSGIGAATTPTTTSGNTAVQDVSATGSTGTPITSTPVPATPAGAIVSTPAQVSSTPPATNAASSSTSATVQVPGTNNVLTSYFPPSSTQPPTFTSTFYNPSLGGLNGPTGNNVASGTTSYNLPGSTNTGSRLIGIVSTGNVSPQSGNAAQSTTNASFTGSSTPAGTPIGIGIISGGGGGEEI